VKKVSAVLCTFLFGTAVLCCRSLHAQTPAITLSTKFPAYLHQGDRTELHLTIHNRGIKETTGQAQLLLQDAKTGTPVDGWFQNFFPNQYFTVAANDSTTIAFPVEVPYTFFGAASVLFVWRTASDSGSVQKSLATLPQERPNRQNLVLRNAGSYTLKPLSQLQDEETRHASLGLQLAASPAAFAFAALPALAHQPALPSVGLIQRLSAHAIALQLWRTQPGAAHQIFTGTGHLNFTDSSWLQSHITQNIAALASAQAPGGGWPAWPGAKADAGITAQIVLGIGRLQRLQALDIVNGRKLLQIAHKGLGFLQTKRDTQTAYLEDLLKTTPKTPTAAAAYYSKQLEDETSFQLEKAALASNRPLCDKLAAALLTNWNKATLSMAKVYALLLAYPAALQLPPAATVQWGGMAPQTLPQKEYLPEATVPAARIQPAAGNMRLQVADSSLAWALVSWQYAEAANETEGKPVQQQWYLLKAKQKQTLAAGSTISLGDTIETVIHFNKKEAAGTTWVAAGMPAGLRPIQLVFNARQMWASEHEGAVYTWLSTTGMQQWTVRMVANHRGFFTPELCIPAAITGSPNYCWAARQ
jgi:hypothetical protein